MTPAREKSNTTFSTCAAVPSPVTVIDLPVEATVQRLPELSFAFAYTHGSVVQPAMRPIYATSPSPTVSPAGKAMAAI